MLPLVLMLSLGQVDGGNDAPIVILDVVQGSLLVRPEDGGFNESVFVEEGCYLPSESCIRAGKQAARKSAELAEANTVGAKWIGLAFVGGAVTGLAIGVAIGIVGAKR